MSGGSMNDSTPATEALVEKGIPHRLFRHPSPVRSLEQAAAGRGQRPEQVVRSLLFRISQGEYILVLAAGPRQISWPALRRTLNQSRLTLASAEEVLAVTGYPVGAVSPFGLPVSLRILVDQSVLQEEEVSIGSGEWDAAVILKTADLLEALDSFEVVSL